MRKNYRMSGHAFRAFCLVVWLLMLSRCGIDDFSESIPSGSANLAPQASIVLPGDTVKNQLEVPIQIDLFDDTPGLSEAIVSIIDDNGTAKLDTTFELIGTGDTLIFNLAANRLGGGEHTIRVRALDTEGILTEVSNDFVARSFISTQDQMFVLGSMNGWGDNDPDLSMTLIDDYTWSITQVRITANDQFKFANTSDFSDLDWTDEDCDGQAEPGGFGANIACGFNGIFDITFNDQTLSYTVEGEQQFLSEFGSMFVLGTLNGWGDNDPNYEMSLIADSLWEVRGVQITAADEFKFVVDTDFSRDFTDPQCDGVANESGGLVNIACGFEGTVKIRFNEGSKEYSVTADLDANELSMFMLGTMNGWENNDPDYEMTLIDNNTWQVGGVSLTADDEFKFVTTTSFSKDFTDTMCDGVADESGGVVNIACGFEGSDLTVTFNDETKEYTVE